MSLTLGNSVFFLGNTLRNYVNTMQYINKQNQNLRFIMVVLSLLYKILECHMLPLYSIYLTFKLR